ncbi:MAG: FHA domain-containing protein [Acidobacteriota bacterium]
MSDQNFFDKAEIKARRIFEKLGARVDAKFSSENVSTLSQREVSDLIDKLEREIDSHLKPNSQGLKSIPPPFFKVLIPYERAPQINPKYLESLVSELKTALLEHMVNRRYERPKVIRLAIARDFFEKSIGVKSYFEEKDWQVLSNDLLAPKLDASKVLEPAKKSTDVCQLNLRSDDGQLFQVELKANAAPVSIGRTAGNRIRIEDASISRQHCSISLRSDGRIVVADLGSANGTAINNRFLNQNEAGVIKIGDVLSIGDVNLTVEDLS